MVDYVEKVQHLQRCSPHINPQPRVVRAIAWQPWAIKSATPTALTRLFHDVINIYMRINKWWIMSKRYNTYSVVPHT